jgi:hypothetical protein
MHQVYSIPPDTAKRATEDYLACMRAGMLPVLHSRIRDDIAYHRSLQWHPSGQYNHDAPRLDAFRDTEGWNLRGIRGEAADLAKLLECDAEDVLPHLFEERWTGPTTRRIAQQALADVGAMARKQLCDLHSSRRRQPTTLVSSRRSA